jgi:hypothetical protein
MDLPALEGWMKRRKMTTIGDHQGSRIERPKETHWAPRAKILLNLKADLKCLYEHLYARLAD